MPGHEHFTTTEHAAVDHIGYAILQVGTDAGKPAAGTAGRFYYATDTKILLRDTGAAWEEVAREQTVIDHGSVAGLADDDHTNLWNNTRGDAKIATHAAIVLAHHDHAATGIVDHANLSNVLTAQHHTKTVDASELSTGRQVVARLPDGVSGLIPICQGAGSNVALKNIAGLAMAASGNIFVAANTERTTVNVAYTKLKEFVATFHGGCRVFFNIKTNTAGVKAWGRVYVNAGAVGIEHDNQTTSYVLQQDDITCEIGDKIQIYLKSDNGVALACIQNASLAGNLSTTPVTQD